MINLQAHALNRVVECNGSVHMPEIDLPDEERNEDQEEGVAAHHVAIEVIAGRNADPIEWVDRQTPNGVWVTPEMAEYVDDFTDVIAGRRGAHIWLEENVDFQLSEDVRILCRLDVATWMADIGNLTVDDFKYGWRLVEPFENWQLVAGAAGIMIKYQLTPSTIDLIIHQPRPHHRDGKVRKWSLTYDEFWLAYGKMKEALRVITDELRTGPHCYRCPSMLKCPAYHAATYNALDASGRVFDDGLSDTEAASELVLIRRAKDILEQKDKALTELITHRINSQHVVPNWFIERGEGKRRWKKGVTVSMIKALTLKDINKPDMLSPAQAEKAGISPLIVNAFSERPPTTPKLVNRSAASVASKMFKPPAKES